MSEGFDKLAGAIGDTLKTAPEFYNDGLKSSIEESGKTLALVPRAINAALVPLRQWISEREYQLAETEKLLAQKLENIDENKIVTPKAYVAVPAIQAISYSMDSEELRNLYANLLAKSMNIDTKDYVHPAYVNIISQMTPLDAKILQFIRNKPDKDFPIIQLVAANDTSQILLQPNITPITFASIEAISISIENLSRNNLVYIIDEIYAEESDGYNSIYKSKNYKEYVEIQKNNLPSSYPFLETEEKTCILSALGRSFCDICIS